MDGYSAYPQQQQQQQQRPYAPRNNGSGMLEMPVENMNMGMGYDMDSQQFDDMVTQHQEKADRRKSMPAYQNMAMQQQLDSMDSRRLSMLDFGNQGGNQSGLSNFEFNPQTGNAMSGMMRGNTSYPHTAGEMQGGTLSSQDLAINTQFANQNSSYNMPSQGSAYDSPLHPVSMDMGMNSYANALSMPLDMSDPSMAIMGSDMGMFSGNQFASPLVNSPIAPDFMMSSRMPEPAPDMDQMGAFRNAALRATADVRVMPSRTGSNEHGTPQSRSDSASLSTPTSLHNQNQIHTPTIASEAANPQSQHEVPTESFAQMSLPFPTPPGGYPSTIHGNTHVTTKFKNSYSTSGFDMMDILLRVKHRSNPKIPLGPVDFDCAFVVCDIDLEDCPIVYCSRTFTELTGYDMEEIINKNCRFLQAPWGDVKRGEIRRFTDNVQVGHLRDAVFNRTEAQVTLVNYRKGRRSPFMNLLTMIPISMQDGGPIKYFVGFQVDITENPEAVMKKITSSGHDPFYQMDYRRPAHLLSNRLWEHGPGRLSTEIGQTISKDEVSSVLATYATADNDISRRTWDKILLENTDDVIHVLSLKGLFLYLSPSSNKALEYDPSELVGTPLSSICHPSDIVSVTRELKETTNGSPVNVVFRIRRKKSGYMWFEGHGSLHTEQGKGRKCIILVGRKRPVYALSKSIVSASGGIGDNELWSKMSTSGMFLFVSGNVRQLLDRQPEELVGTSIQALMRPESKQNFAHALEIVRTGRKAEAKHEMINRRGQVLQAFTTLYPGDAAENEKPTFVVAQTRLLKYSRSAHGQRPSMYANKEHHSGDSRGSVPSLPSDASSAHPGTGASTPGTNASDGRFRPSDTPVLPYNNPNTLAIGHQDGLLASDDNVFDELKTTKSSSWQYELRQMEKRNRYLAEEVQSLLAAKKKRKRRKGAGQMQKDCANCHTRTTPEWRRGPSGNRDLCNSCGLRWAKQVGRVSPRNSSHNSVSDKGKKSVSPRHAQPLLPNVLSDPGAVPSIPVTALGPGEKRAPTQANTDSHAAKLARMESTAPRGYGGGIPPKIDEAVEPSE